MNLFKQFERLLPKYPLRVGTVTAVDGTTVHIDELGGGTVVVRGEATVGNNVYFRDGVVEGIAPNLTLEVIEE